MKILGICAYYHNSGAALVVNDEIKVSVQETYLTNVTHITGFPTHSISYCLKKTGIEFKDLDAIVFYDKPLIASKLLDEADFVSPDLTTGSNISLQLIASQLDKQNIIFKLTQELATFGKCQISDLPPIDFIEHNQSQATSAFFLSPFQRSAIICLNSVGDWATASVWLARDNQLIPQWKLDFPHSAKMICSAFTYYTGIQFDYDEYKLKELAPKGRPKYADFLLEKILESEENGIFQIKTDYLYNMTQLTVNNQKSEQVFKASKELKRKTSQWEMDIAASIQKVREEITIRLINSISQELKEDFLCLAGDIGYYYKLNSRIMRENSFKDIWIQPRIDYSTSAALTFWYQRAPTYVA